ncbi:MULTISPECIES: thioredoxin domain-containing protein [unclassified Microbacterium]|uniref:thioredoxin domain-containing protein n=1 Tax=unclassified Microbacterium TaxID=2609290 RepID=UPI001604B144|nr:MULTISPECIES: thioredoxin family protein [unclassified Microbacterium]QNA91885.1 thioredoxin family protein [Microbacterium sp. Se63.02b]QYM65105.1 thioredoxin family protein [Microbacterium sp. Se5.02b]
MELTLVSSSFCGACARTRAVLGDAARYLPDAVVSEIDIAHEPDLAEELDIRFTPTVIIRDASGTEVFRAEGVPTVPQVLTAAVRALPE